MKDEHKCRVCGARVTTFAWDCCSRTCASAKKNGRTRYAQLIAEMRCEAVVSRFEEQEALNLERLRFKADEDRYYNQPYLYGT